MKSSYFCIVWSLSKDRSKISLNLITLKSKQSLNTLNGCMRFLSLCLGFNHTALMEIFQGTLEINTSRVTRAWRCVYIHFLFMHTMTVLLGWNNIFPSQSAFRAALGWEFCPVLWCVLSSDYQWGSPTGVFTGVLLTCEHFADLLLIITLVLTLYNYCKREGYYGVQCLHHFFHSLCTQSFGKGMVENNSMK